VLRWSKRLVFCLGLVPLGLLFYGAVSNQLGPDPGESLMHATGEWAARLLILTLIVSPLRSWTGLSGLLRLRRMLGLFTFFYACLHLFLFLHFYLGWLPSVLWEELVERPYITVGFSAWLIMLPLAVTSTTAMQRRLRRNWQRLHRGIYPVAVLVSLHILWQARSDLGEALFYTLVFAALLSWRLIRFRAKQASTGST
jgi:sulfoxide reductase heme-binding subunit YedZ